MLHMGFDKMRLLAFLCLCFYGRGLTMVPTPVGNSQQGVSQGRQVSALYLRMTQGIVASQGVVRRPVDLNHNLGLWNANVHRVSG
jgi:hypothetical protein